MESVPTRMDASVTNLIPCPKMAWVNVQHSLGEYWEANILNHKFRVYRQLHYLKSRRDSENPWLYVAKMEIGGNTRETEVIARHDTLDEAIAACEGKWKDIWEWACANQFAAV